MTLLFTEKEMDLKLVGMGWTGLLLDPLGKSRLFGTWLELTELNSETAQSFSLALFADTLQTLSDFLVRAGVHCVCSC
jgi:hypothetical protein